MDASMSRTAPSTPPCLPNPSKQREFDEMSIASDFSVIPESLVDGDGGALPTRTISTTSFLHSEDLQPSLSAMASHTKVTFHSVQATYFCDSDIAISYTLGSDVSPKSSDRVGLYKVGFSSPQDYIGYRWAPTPTPDHTANTLPLTVVFKASSLPTEVGEFFQFCYVTCERQIVGVSAPFQLLRVGACREMCVVEEDGMVVVRSSESVLHDKINELTVVKDQLQGETKELNTLKAEMTKQLQDKTQQLTMCQHHLQALEVKMKRETEEKCELMGRVGQVVEEKGHLEDKLRTLERSITVERAKAAANETKLKELEETTLTSRKSLEQMTLTVRSLEADLNTTKDDLKMTSECLEVEKAAKEKAATDLELWATTTEMDESERHSLALKLSTVNEELINKLEELDRTRKHTYSLQEKLKGAEKELEEAKTSLASLEERLESVEKEKSVFLEREEVLGQDNTHLQGSNTALKDRVADLEEEQRSDVKGREAAETIASDLSGRLQAAKAEYHTLALTNRKLVKKLKKMRHKAGAETATTTATATATDMTTSTTSTSSWLYAEIEEENETETENENETDDHSENSDHSSEDEPPTVMTQSQHTVTTSSCCSHSTQQLSDAVNKKMEGIVRELSQQIMSLKVQLQDKEEKKEEEESDPQPQPQPQPQQEKEEEEEVVQAVEEETPPQKTPTADTAAKPEPTTILYSNSFLPTAPTAPVFLPEGGNTTTAPIQKPPTATATPIPTEPTPAPRAHYYPQQNAAPPQQVPTAGRLPPPLLPVTTPTARHAAVYRHLTHQLPTAPAAHDSDDDDFHSTGDSDSSHLPPTVSSPPPPPPPSLPLSSSSSPPSVAVEASFGSQHQSQPKETDDDSASLMPCPLCSLFFPRGTDRLLEEHVNSHLEHVCPVCSMVFQRNCQDKFQEHVQSHFEEDNRERREAEARQEAEDTSGPWGQHIRHAHTLEFD